MGEDYDTSGMDADELAAFDAEPEEPDDDAAEGDDPLEAAVDRDVPDAGVEDDESTEPE